MATRAQQRLSHAADIRPYEVLAANTVRHGMPVKLSSGKIVEAAAMTDDIIGIAYQQLTNVPQTTAIPATGWTAPAGSKVNVWHFGSHGACPVRVGTGGATVGLPLRLAAAADGVTNATVGGGTGKIVVVGTCLETGAAGDLVGVNLGTFSYTVGS